MLDHACVTPPCCVGCNCWSKGPFITGWTPCAAGPPLFRQLRGRCAARQARGCQAKAAGAQPPRGSRKHADKSRMRWSVAPLLLVLISLQSLAGQSPTLISPSCSTQNPATMATEQSYIMIKPGENCRFAPIASGTGGRLALRGGRSCGCRVLGRQHRAAGAQDRDCMGRRGCQHSCSP